MSQKILLLDLFHTLVRPVWTPEDTEYYALGIDGSRWYKASADERLYRERATGLVRDPKEIVAKIAQKAGLALDPRMINLITKIRIQKFKDTLLEVDDEVLTTLAYLKERSYKLCLISNADIIDVLHWNESPLKPYFDHAIFSYEVGIMKPDAGIYELGLNRMGGSSEEAIFIGDGGSDELHGAKAVGIETIMTTQYTFYGQEAFENRAQHADRQIERFAELKHLL